MEIQSGNRIIRVSTEHLSTHEAIRQRFDLYFEAVEPKKEIVSRVSSTVTAPTTTLGACGANC